MNSGIRFLGTLKNYCFIIFFCVIESLLCTTKFKESQWQDLGLLKVRISYHYFVMQLNTCQARQEIRHLTKTRTFMGTTLDSQDLDISTWILRHQFTIRSPLLIMK